MRVRVLIQERGKKDKFIAQFTLEAENIEEIINRLKKHCSTEISERERLFLDYLNNRKKEFIKSLVEDIDEDLIDWKSKGNDISKEEFLENEIYFAMRE